MKQYLHTHGAKVSLIVADKDGVLSESHSSIVPTKEIAAIVARGVRFVIITGAAEDRVREEVLGPILAVVPKEHLSRIDVIVNNGAGILRFDGDKYVLTYERRIDTEIGADKKQQVLDILQDTRNTFPEIANIKATYPEITQICDEDIQIVLRVLGKIQNPELRATFDPDGAKRAVWAHYIREAFKMHNIALRVSVDGTSSINILVPEIHKGSGIKELAKEINTPLSEIVYLGDSFREHKNDWLAVSGIIDLAINFGNPIDEEIAGTVLIDHKEKGVAGATTFLTALGA